MRLIDADELKHNLAYSDEVRFKYLDDFNKVCRFIDQQPTAVVQCGEWIEAEITAHWDCVCSNCRSFYIDQDEVAYYKFCPSCGARMGSQE